MKVRIAVTGKHGQVVSALLERGSRESLEVIAVGRPELDLCDRESIATVLLKIKPDVVVSAAAYTAVDRAESEEALAFISNAQGPSIIAEVSSELDIPIIHLSTDYVFRGDKQGSYVETDETGPLSAYGRSKLAGEIGVATANSNHVILRTAWVYSPFGTNFLKTMLRLAASRDALNVVDDQTGTPTSAFDIADAIIAIAKRLSIDRAKELRGVFHMTGYGEATWADFAEDIFASLKAQTGRTVLVHRISTSDYPTPAKRPMNSRLSNEKLKEIYGIILPDWKESAKAVLNRLL